jgi:hypothetical protein
MGREKGDADFLEEKETNELLSQFGDAVWGQV